MATFEHFPDDAFDRETAGWPYGEYLDVIPFSWSAGEIAAILFHRARNRFGAAPFRFACTERRMPGGVVHVVAKAATGGSRPG